MVHTVVVMCCGGDLRPTRWSSPVAYTAAAYTVVAYTAAAYTVVA